jgi:hypothetical protein
VSAGLSPVTPPVVIDRDLVNAKPRGPGSDQQLGIDKCTHRGQGNRLDHPAVEELERAVDIPYPQTKNQANQATPDAGDD